MKKVSVPATNDLCPQSLFVYGTQNPDGSPNFGLFCWFTYCPLEPFGVICSIGGSKRTLENIRRNGVFSANLVVEENLALADYFGTADGREDGKMDIPVDWEPGEMLKAPTLCSSPLSYELEVVQEIPIGSHDETVLLCRIRNTLKSEALLDPALLTEERYRLTGAVHTAIECFYWSWDGRNIGQWHARAREIKADVEIGAAARGE